MDKEIKISKIVANSTPNAWSQAYNAGKLFAVLSLSSETPTEENALNLLGKELLDNLEAEYFALETKDMENVKKAVLTSLEKIQSNIKASFAVGTIVNNILYAFAKNSIVKIKRDEKLGTILGETENLEASSGFLENGDILLLETSEFANLIPEESLFASPTSDLSEITENLAPLVHEKSTGAACALLLDYQEEKEPEFLGEEKTEPESEIEESALQEGAEAEQKPKRAYFSFFSLAFERAKKVPNINFPLERGKRTIYIVAAALVLVFIVAVLFAVRKQSDQKNNAVLSQYYDPALKKYEEGQGLLDLNQSLARDSFQASQKLLLQAEPKLSRGSSQEKKVSDLLSKVNDILNKTANAKSVSPQEVSSKESPLLASESDSTLFGAKDGNDIYTLDQSGVSKNGKQIIKKDWDSPGGFGVYFGNVYVLDKTAKQVIKYVATSNEYVKTNYFTKDTTPDVASAQGLAIDGSIWILLKDGTVLKFTRGSSDNLTFSGLDKPFTSPTRIFTNTDSSNVYILDNGNSRIVVFDKKGAYVSQYQSPLFKDTKDFEIQESSKKIFILNTNKVYLLNL